jgi:hypothetical protein
MLRAWLDTWSGVGHILDAMTAAGHHVELRQSVFGWRAEFHREAMQHSRSTWAGVGTDLLPWRAVQVGAAGRAEAGSTGRAGAWLSTSRRNYGDVSRELGGQTPVLCHSFGLRPTAGK